MAYIKLKVWDSGVVGLTTVGYQLKNADGTNNGSRITTGIVAIGNGVYQSNVSFPDGFSGGIMWDATENTSLYGYEDINSGMDEYTDAKVTTRALETTVQSILTETQSHPTLAEIEATTILAKEATSFAIKTVTDKFLFDASNFVKAVQQGAVDILQAGADKVWVSASRTLTSFGTLIADIWAYTTRALTTRTIGADTLPTSAEINTTLSTAHGAGSWEGGGGAPTVQQIDTQLTSTHGAGSWQSSTGGTGTNTVTITLTETGGVIKIPGATVSIKNQAGDTLLATGTTDANGQVQFMLNDGTYSVYKQKLGSYSFTNPETLTVSGNTSASYIGTPISVSAPASPDICKLYIYAYNTDGTVISSGLIGSIRIKTPPYSVSTLNYEGEEIALQYDVAGLCWYANMPKGATVIVNIFAFGYQGKEAVVPNVPTQLIKDLTWLN